MSGNAFYVLATQTGRLDIAAVLSSLYPVVTVILAVLILREHVSRRHAIGIAAAALAIAIIAAGTASPAA
jgi:drug/metabolite transporter (DMT)-like permease